MGQHLMRGALVAGTVAAAAGLGAAPGALLGAPAALAPVDLSGPGASATGPRVGMDASGALVVVWRSRTADAGAILASVRPPGGAPSAPEPLSDPAVSASGPALAVAPSGDALAAWWREGDAGTVVQVAPRAAGAAFAPASDVSGAGAFAPRVALGPDGGAIVAWLRFDGTATVVEAATRPPGGGFGAPTALSEPGRNAFAPQVAIDGAGRVAVAWNRFDGRATRIQATLGTLADGLGPARTLSAPGEDAYDPQLRLTPSGAALVAWTRSDGARTRVQIAELAADDAEPPAPATLSAPGADADQPRLALDAGGAPVVAWVRGPAAARRVQIAAGPSAAELAPPVDVSAAGTSAADPELAVDPAGRALVAWRHADASDPRVLVASRDPGGPWGAPMNVSTRGVVVAEPGIALDGSGNGVVVWRRAAGDDDIVQMAGLDDAPPVLTDVSVPPTALVGAPVRLSVRARDVWSALAEGPTWSLGQGAIATGTTVDHAFPAAGAVTVRIAQADAVGRVAVLERRIDVAAPPAPAPPPAVAPALGTGAAPPRALRRVVTLRASIREVRRGSRIWLRVRGVTSPRLHGRRVLLERRVRSRAVPLCRVRVRARGGFDGRCRVDRLVRGRATPVRVRVRVRVTATPTTRARASRWVTGRLAPLRPAGRAVR